MVKSINIQISNFLAYYMFQIKFSVILNIKKKQTWCYCIVKVLYKSCPLILLLPPQWPWSNLIELLRLLVVWKSQVQDQHKGTQHSRQGSKSYGQVWSWGKEQWEYSGMETLLRIEGMYRYGQESDPCKQFNHSFLKGGKVKVYDTFKTGKQSELQTCQKREK